MYSELQELDLLRSEMQDRVIAERHDWTLVSWHVKQLQYFS
jgi:hypothetical protein